MAYFVTVDSSSNITGLYSDVAGYAPVPTGATQISDADGDTLRHNQMANYQYITGALVLKPLSIQDAQTAAYAAIDNQAGATRLKYITDVAGQSETYLSKASDAANYKAAAYPAAAIASYPMVQAEARALYGATPSAAQYQAAADGILTQQAQWIQLAAAIEQQRRGGKLAVQAAATVAAVQAAQQAAITALGLL